MDPNNKLTINHVKDEEDNLILFIAGDLDVQTAPQLRRFIDTVIREGAVNVRLDLSQLSYLDSSGYGVLIDAARRAGHARCQLDVTSMPPWMTDFFDMSALEA